MMSSVRAAVQPAHQRAEEHARRPLGDVVYEKLVNELILLHFPPEARLSVDLIARQLGVSQTPVRAALARLEAEGLVTRKYNTGFRVAPMPTVEQLREMYLMRSLLEPEVTGLAAQRAPEAAVRELRAVHDDLARLAADDIENNYARFAIRDGDFHAHIAAMSQSPLIQHALEVLHVNMHLFRPRPHASVAEFVIVEHLAIVDCIASGDRESAKAAMARHVAASRARVLGE